jgi:hypothetical protein
MTTTGAGNGGFKSNVNHKYFDVNGDFAKFYLNSNAPPKPSGDGSAVPHIRLGYCVRRLRFML